MKPPKFKNKISINRIIERKYRDKSVDNFFPKRQKFSPSGLSVIDTSNDPVYNLSAPTSVNEGESFNITLNTENVDNGTEVPYTITGVQTDDIGDTSLIGSFTVGSDESRLFLVTADDLTEGVETLTLTLDNNQANVDITINEDQLSGFPYTFPIQLIYE